MTEQYDALETREPAEREADLFSRLPDVLRKAMAAPILDRQPRRAISDERKSG